MGISKHLDELLKKLKDSHVLHEQRPEQPQEQSTPRPPENEPKKKTP
jgi:hypothetical protein